MSVLLPPCRSVLILTLLVAGSAGTALARRQPAPESVERSEILEDLRQMEAALDSIHPDPYTWGGGRIAFHRRLHHLRKSVPAEGWSAPGFFQHLRPFIAAIRDGHTYLVPSSGGGSGEPGLPIGIRLLAGGPKTPDPRVYVQSIRHADSTSLIGSIIETVNGVSMDTLIARQRLRKGFGNEFGNLRNLQLTLGNGGDLSALLMKPLGDSIRVDLALPDGSLRTVRLAPGDAPNSHRADIVPASAFGEPAFGFVDDRSVAVLRLDNTWMYREFFEPHLGSESAPSWIDGVARVLAGSRTDPTVDSLTYAEVIPRIPAATDILRAGFQAMRERRTDTLVVDIRHNSGGSSIVVDMLLYFLEGKEGMRIMDGTYSIDRMYGSRLDETQEDSVYPLHPGDFYFGSEERAARPSTEEPANLDYLQRASPTFAAELNSGSSAGLYRPPVLIVLTSPYTFSGGFWVASVLQRMGAVAAGVPSGQEGNHFANVSFITLENSGITVGISSRYFVLFPARPDGMRVLPVDIPLTREAWRARGFSADAEYDLVLSGKPD